MYENASIERTDVRGSLCVDVRGSFRGKAKEREREGEGETERERERKRERETESERERERDGENTRACRAREDFETTRVTY